jgi:1,4-dihydroxy-6-naphthoate synthase
VDAGVIIHEGRFTYPAYDLVKILDLGQWWEQTTGLPIPLGAIVLRRSLGPAAARWAEQAIQDSLDCAEARADLVWPFIRRHAQEMDEVTITEHIQTFVNPFTRNLGPEGLRAIQELLGVQPQ